MFNLKQQYSKCIIHKPIEGNYEELNRGFHEMATNLISLSANQLAWYQKILSKFKASFKSNLTNSIFLK